MTASPDAPLTPSTGEPRGKTALRLFPEPTIRLAAEDVYKDVSFPASPVTRPYVAINGVASLDGKVTVYGKAGPIGGPVDRTLMRNLRANADAVMIGASTLRAEKLTLAVPESLARTREARGLRPQPLAVVATATGNVPLRENLIDFSPDNLLVLVSPDAPEERLATLSSYASAIEVVPRKVTKTSEGVASSEPDINRLLDLTKALETLKKRYAVGVLLVEGGPTLNHALVSAGLADELFLTLAPKLLGSTRLDTLTILEGPAQLAQKSPNPELTSIHLYDNELFLRYALRAKDGTRYS